MSYNRLIKVILFLQLILLVFFIPYGYCKTIYVDDDGLYDYSTIQSALNSAEYADTIYVYPGEYIESIVINKSINLVGANLINTTIIGLDEVYTILISSGNVTVSNFTIRDGDTALYISSNDFNSNIVAENNIIYNNSLGVYLGTSSNNNYFYNNTFIDGVDGFMLYSSSENAFINNSVEEHSAYGFSLWEHSNDNLIIDNYIEHCGRGILVSRWSNDNVIKNNYFFETVVSCIEIDHSNDNLVIFNTLEGLKTGVSLKHSAGNIISNNSIQNMDIYGIRWIDGDGNFIMDNLFLNCRDETRVDTPSVYKKLPVFEIILILAISLIIIYFIRRERKHGHF